MSRTKNQRGQMTVELVMLIIVGMMVVSALKAFLEEQEFMANLSINPWNNYIAGMIENGVWMPADKGRAYHPHTLKRHASREGEKVQ